MLVRWIEFNTIDLRYPAALFFLTGISLAGISLFTRSNLLSGVLGILGIIFFWNGIETRHQEKRVKQGHAPANPANPRHQRILKENPDATTENLLKHNHLIGKGGLP